MENRLTRFVYNHSPVFLQHLYVSAFGLQKKWQRYGRWFSEYRRFFSESAKWSKAELETFQDEKVREVVCNAYENVPFYRQRMDSLGLEPDDICGVADLPKLPLLEKSEVRQAGSDMLSRAFPRRKLLSASTSGSTGSPITNYWTKEAFQREYGFGWARRKIGVNPGDSYASFMGQQICRADSLKPPFWRHNLPANQTCYSIFHIAPQTIPAYLEKMKRMRHVYLVGYPSVIALLGKFILDNGIDWPCPPQAMFTEAEELLPDHRRWIEKGFKTRVYNNYGQGEKAGSITEYSCGHLHYDMDYSVIEFVPVGRDNGDVIAEIVCTAFDNPAYPLIRYRIGDLALLPGERVECSLWSSQVVKAIFGRTAHSLISRDGRRINNITVIVRNCQNVEMVQCVQYEPGEVEIRVVRGPGHTKEDERDMLFQFGQKVGEMDFKIVYVDSIERTRRGKFLSIISKVPPEKVTAFQRLSG